MQKIIQLTVGTLLLFAACSKPTAVVDELNNGSEARPGYIENPDLEALGLAAMPTDTVNGRVYITIGDMAFDPGEPHHREYLYSILDSNEETASGKTSGTDALRLEYYDLWTWGNGLVFFHFMYDGSGCSEATKQRVRTAMQAIEAVCNVIFLEVYYPGMPCVNIYEYHDPADAASARASIGRISAPYIKINTAQYFNTGTIAHELMHVLGFGHEHERSDRNNYIAIIDENVITGYIQYFDVFSWEDPVSYGPYDYHSIMHYYNRAFSKNGLPTIDAGAYSGVIGQSSYLSFTDKQALKYYYGDSKKITHMINYKWGAVFAYDNGRIYYEPDFINRWAESDNDNICIYNGGQTVTSMMGYNDGIITQFSGTNIYYSPDGLNLGGGGSTVIAYGGTQRVMKMIPYNGGVITAFESGSIWYSPDGLNLGGGGSSVKFYDNGQTIKDMIPYQGGVMYAFSGGSIWFNATGYGSWTSKRYAGSSPVKQMLEYQGGILTAFEAGTIYFSPDGYNLGGGGNTVWAYNGSSKLRQMIQYDYKIIAAFDNYRVYSSPDGLNLGGGGQTSTVYSGSYAVNDIEAYTWGGVYTAFDNGCTYVSMDAQNLGGGGITYRVIPENVRW